MIFRDAFLMVNSVEMSDLLQEANFPTDAEMKDDTRMGNSTRVSEAGLVNHSLTCKFVQDFAVGKTNATLFPLRGAAAFPIRFRADKTAAISATNPEFQFSAVLENYTPIAGGVGDKLYANASFKPGGGLAGNLVVDITP